MKKLENILDYLVGIFFILTVGFLCSALVFTVFECNITALILAKITAISFSCLVFSGSIYLVYTLLHPNKND